MKADLDRNIARLLGHQVADVIDRAELEKKLRSRKKLRIKLGADPSRPDLHLGHAVVLRKLREFQDLGHTVIFLIGDFTAKIGDPTGKSKTRPMLSDAEIEANAATYLNQVGRILDIGKGEIRRNSEWLGGLGADGFVQLCAQFTVARIIERDDFAKRLAANADVHMHELLYPMLQAYDSVALEADVELGATDQTFNLLAGRALMKKKAMAPQDVLTCPILVGTDGKEKMSKSLGNFIGLLDSAEEMFGKTMSIPDSALDNWLELAADLSPEELAAERAALAAGQNPRDVKMRLASRIAALYHGTDAAASAEAAFKARFQKGEMPTSIPEKTYPGEGDEMTAATLVGWAFGISNSEARRLMAQGGIRANREVIKDPVQILKIPAEGLVLQRGKLFFVKVIKN